MCVLHLARWSVREETQREGPGEDYKVCVWGCIIRWVCMGVCVCVCVCVCGCIVCVCITCIRCVGVL